MGSSDFYQAVQNNLYCMDSVNKNNIASFSQVYQYVTNGQCAPYTLKSAAGKGTILWLLLIPSSREVYSIR